MAPTLGLSAVGFDSVLETASARPLSVGVFSDFDGTLSELIEVPAEVLPVAGAVEAIDCLATLCGTVAIVSGRPVSFLGEFFSPLVELSGLYGIEHRSGSKLEIDEAAVEWLPVIEAVAVDGASRFGESVVENKTYSLTVHYRTETADTAAAIESWAEETGGRHGLHVGRAKMSVELHPPISRDKGDAIGDMLDGISVAVYFGDDRGDRSGFERLLTARREGALACAATVLVRGAETPAELCESATDIVATPHDVVAMLEQLSASMR